MASNQIVVGSNLISDGPKPNSDGLHFSAFPQEFGTAACGGGNQANYRDLESYELQVSALCERRLELEHVIFNKFQSMDVRPSGS